MDYPWSKRHPWVPSWFPTQIKYSIIWHCAGDCHFQCPYCLAGAATRRDLPLLRTWTDEEAVAAWEQVFNQLGACHLSFTGLEPSEDLDLIASVLAWHYGSIQTNLSFDIDRFMALISPGRIDLHPSFHPHAWGMEIAPFMEKVDALLEAGYHMPLIAVVAYPPYLPRLAEWVEAISERNIYPNIAPMVRAEYEGKPYPESYTAEEWAMIRNVTPGHSGCLAALKPLHITACGAGHVVAVVTFSGDIWRCGKIAGMGDQNLFRDGCIEWLAEPQPCPVEFCPCPQFHQLHIREGREDNE